MKLYYVPILRPILTVTVVAIAAVVGIALWDYYTKAPWTRDGKVRADVVTVTPDVSGLVTEVLVKDNQRVAKGDLLFRVDPERFRLAVRQAVAVVDGKKALAEQTKLDYDRYVKLSYGTASQQKLEMVRAASQEAEAAYNQAVVDRDLANLNLARSEVRASVNGRVANVDLQPGAYVTVSRGVMALIAEDTIRVEGYFEETKLARIHVGDVAQIRLVGERVILTGHVESIAGGIEDRERSSGTNLLANVNPTFTWVRLAQRIPVRIALDLANNRSALVVGRTATVEILGNRNEQHLFQVDLSHTRR